MIQYCGDSVTLSFAEISKSSLSCVKIHFSWCMENGQHSSYSKKEAKYLVKNNRHTNTTSKSFANISQGFWKTLFNFLFSHFNNANLFTKCKSGFMPVDSCISQLHRLIASHPLLLEQYSCGSRVYCFN